MKDCAAPARVMGDKRMKERPDFSLFFLKWNVNSRGEERRRMKTKKWPFFILILLAAVLFISGFLFLFRSP